MSKHFASRRDVLCGFVGSVLGLCGISSSDGQKQQKETKQIPEHDHSSSKMGGTTIEAERAYIRSPSISPGDEATAERQIHNVALETAEKSRLITPNDTNWTNHDVFWPTVIPANKLFDDPLGDFYLYYSEDHGNPGAIGLAYSDSPLGPFTDYAGNPVISGQHERETPSAVWNETEERLFMYYHSDALGTTQSTGLTTSEDGLHFEDQGVVIDVPPNTPGRGHTGYARVSRLGNEWISYHLMGGGGDGRMGISYSVDGRNWRTDPRPLPISADVTGANDQRVNWHHTNLVTWNGRPWWFGSVGPFVSGPDRADPRLCAAPLLDERQIAREPTVLIEPTTEWEGNDTKIPHVLTHNSRMFIYYSSGGKIGGVKMAGGTI